MSVHAYELLQILDISAFDSELPGDDLFQQVIEKASRLLGVQKLILSLDNPVLASCNGCWGFMWHEDPFAVIEHSKPNSYLHRFTNAPGYLYLEQKEPVSIQKQRLYTIFARSLEDALTRKEIKESLLLSERKYRDILANMQEGYYEIDIAGRIVFCNQSLYELLGYGSSELAGINMLSLCVERRRVFRIFRTVWEKKSSRKINTIKMRRKDGSILYAEASIRLIKDSGGVITGFCGLVRDITERIDYQQRLEFLSMHDVLTGVYNRSYFEEYIAKEIEAHAYPISLLVADLDGLKIINDSMGHHCGDQLLRSFAQILSDCVGENGVIARLGGDEFGVILPNYGRRRTANLVETVRNAIDHYNQDNPTLPLSISLGHATASDGSTTLTELYKRADDNMLHDKLYRSASMKSEIVKSSLLLCRTRLYYSRACSTDRKNLYCHCQKLGLSETQQADLALLAQVHDLGKVGIPDSILNKRGRLSEAEIKVMRQHPEKGYRIATASPHLAGIARLILCHHERWDGKGYPLGLAGTEIPVECRILAIADAYDAMTGYRPYRKPFDHEKAVQELQVNAGIQFDPDLIEVAIPILNELKNEVN